MRRSFLDHWPEYLIEAACLATFMVSACTFTVLLQYPGSMLHQAIGNPFIRRMLIGIAMGLTAIALIYSPWGKQSGAHMNPSITLTFFRLGKVKKWDALFYMAAQFVGGVTGVLLSTAVLGTAIADPAVNYAVTSPGSKGIAVAFAAELVISFCMMTLVLHATNSKRLQRYTGLLAGCLVAIYITFEAPFSGMSMNPARTFGSALPANAFTALWLYFLAPPLGMLLAGEVYTRSYGIRAIQCAKLDHANDKRCIFCGANRRSTAPLTVSSIAVPRL